MKERYYGFVISEREFSTIIDALLNTKQDYSGSDQQFLQAHVTRIEQLIQKLEESKNVSNNLQNQVR